ncbi:MAG: class I SAM-dependent methyltransferase [Anaerolineaceae bacterium]|nr:class I SAM-dependent methyltransferase [Anaerolineaceae bacterium]
MMDELGRLDFSGVEETGLLTLYSKAAESQSADPILKDPMAEAIVARIDPILQQKDGAMARQLRNRAVDPRLNVHLALRSRKYDDYARAFLVQNPTGVIVNMGCGLDMRFFRIDNGQVRFYDLDLPDVIKLKRQLCPQNDRYHLMANSVLDFGWMDQIVTDGGPVLLLAEGIFMYLPEQEVKRLVLALQTQFPESDLVCELTNRTWVEGLWGKLAQFKMQHRLKMQSQSAFQFGVSTPEEFELWGKGIEFRGMWFYMDDDHPKIGWYRIFRGMKIIRTAQFTVRYTLHAA